MITKKLRINEKQFNKIQIELDKEIMAKVKEIKKLKDWREINREVVHPNVLSKTYNDGRNNIITELKNGTFTKIIADLKMQNEDYKIHNKTCFEDTPEYTNVINRYMTLSNGKITDKILEIMKINYDLEGLNFILHKADEEKNHYLKETTKRAIEYFDNDDSSLQYIEIMVNEFTKSITSYLNDVYSQADTLRILQTIKDERTKPIIEILENDKLMMTKDEKLTPGQLAERYLNEKQQMEYNQTKIQMLALDKAIDDTSKAMEYATSKGKTQEEINALFTEKLNELKAN